MEGYRDLNHCYENTLLMEFYNDHMSTLLRPRPEPGKGVCKEVVLKVKVC